MTCKRCLATHRDRRDLIRFADAGGWWIEFTRIHGYCWMCSFMEGFEAYAEYKLSKFGYPGET